MSSDRRERPKQLAHPTEFDELFGRGYPNPDRVGCPPREVLVSLARRERPIGDPAYDHIKECSPCYLEGRAIQEADALQRRRRVLTWAAAAVGILAGAGAYVASIASCAIVLLLLEVNRLPLYRRLDPSKVRRDKAAGGPEPRSGTSAFPTGPEDAPPKDG